MLALSLVACLIPSALNVFIFFSDHSQISSSGRMRSQRKISSSDTVYLFPLGCGVRTFPDM